MPAKKKPLLSMSGDISSNHNLILTIILACFGKVSSIYKDLELTIEGLINVKHNIMLIVVLDGKMYLELAALKNLRVVFPNVNIICLEKQTNLPGKIINAALDWITTPYVTFAWPGSTLDPKIIEFAQNPIWSHHVYSIKSLQTSSTQNNIGCELIYTCSQFEKVFEINYLIVSKEAVKYIGEFDNSPLLQRDFDREWILRLSRYFMFFNYGFTSTANALSIENYPFDRSFVFSSDTIHRYILRKRKVPYMQKVDCISQCEKDFLKDLPDSDMKKIKKFSIEYGFEYYKDFKNPWYLCLRKRYKITIIGGYWENHHNQLCFFNYLDKLYGRGFATYKVLLDDIAIHEDVQGSDLVIISRSRNSKILNIIEYCKKEHIATLYMIDDNWFAIAEDLPEVYGHMFTPGEPPYETFLSAIKQCDSVITYNKLLYDDICQFNKNTILFPLNIDMVYYKQDSPIGGSFNIGKMVEEKEILIGYCGSLRYDDIVFKALANVAAKNENVKILLFGGTSDSQRSLFEDLNTIILNYMPYPIYCRTIKSLSPEILVAPLQNNRTSQSKCPNKYLEAGAIKSAGIYSDLPPYSNVVKDGVNGLCVSNNTVEEWEEKILFLLNNKKLRSKIKKNCYRDIKKHYATEKVLKKFCDIITTIIHKYEKRGN